jgi:tRNA A-37 threonylcarbamoyl transferase component Bud32
MQDDELSMRLVIDFEVLDPPLERILDEVDPTSRLGGRWHVCDPVVGDPQHVLVVDDQGVRGILRFLTKPPSTIHATRLLAMIEQYARIEHSHLERVLDWDVLDERPWIVLPFESVRWMRDWLHEDVPAWVTLIEKFLGVCRAVAQLHRHGLVHGELAPDAFVIDSSGRACVRGTIETTARRLAGRRPDKASIAADQADLCMAMHGALLAIETNSLLESPRWVLEVIERGFAEHVRDQWPSIDDLVDHLEHRLRMRSQLVVLRGGAAA